MRRAIIVILALAVIIAVPFILKPKQNFLTKADDTLVIISPHNEAIRYEFTRAFTEYYKNKTGRTIRIDWRLPGGASEIARYLTSEYYAAFQNAWQTSGRQWTFEVQSSFDNSSVTLPKDAALDNTAQSARRAFLASDVSIGIDLFFGGGTYDFIQQAKAGRLVDCGLISKLPSIFNDNSIPQMVSGGAFYDPQGRWLGTCLASFGICYNTDSLKRLGIDTIPAAWSDLANPRLAHQVALADPTKSGSAAKTFEMIIQQQIQEQVSKSGASTDAAKKESLAKGWLLGMQLIQRISANARYFTDGAPRVPMDVSQGDAAIGMCIDFYGRFQSETIKLSDGTSRLHYFTPAGGSSVDADPIGLLRGAPNSEAAKLFLEFVLSLEGQKLWNFKVGTPGGPTHYALRRLPIRKELYLPEFTQYRSDPDVDPYAEAKLFTYHEGWTGPIFRAMTFVIRVMCLDTNDELQNAWHALIAANFPPLAMARFSDLSAVDYATTFTTIRDALRSGDRIKEIQLAKTLGDHFRTQYREATELAKEGK
ncbi:MAG: extracellular solute-binding protein [Chthoniobacterales bacterium]